MTSRAITQMHFEGNKATQKVKTLPFIILIYLASRLASLISNGEQRVDLLHKLIMSVTVETLTQVSILCGIIQQLQM